MRTTSKPCDITPSAKAADSPGELSRISWPMTTRPEPRAPSVRISLANADPTSNTKASSISEPTSPRTS